MIAKVELFGDRIWLRTSAPTPGLGKRIKGAGWRKEDKVWTFPLRLDVCRLLREEFPNLEIWPDLTAWAKRKLAEELSLTALGSTLTAVELFRVPECYPKLAKALEARPYQSSAVRYVAEAKSALIGDTPGLGKTIEAIAGIVESGVKGPYLIVAPSVALTVWKREIERYLPDAKAIVAKGSFAARAKAVGEAEGDNTWLIINTDMLRTISYWVCKQDHAALPDAGYSEEQLSKMFDWQDDGSIRWRASDKPKATIINCGHAPDKAKTVHEHKHFGLFSEPWGAIVMDESHMALIRLSGTPTQIRNGARLVPLRADGVKLATSGTPMRGKAHQLWGTLNWLRPKEYTGFWSWAETYFEITTPSFYGGRVIGELREDRKALLDRSLNGVMIRRTKAEVSPELPPKQIMGTPLDPRVEGSPIAVWLQMTPEQARAYKEIALSGTASVKGGELTAVGQLAEITRMKQFATSYGEMVEVKGKRQKRTDGKKGKRGPSDWEFRPTLPSNKFDWIVQFLTEMGIIEPDAADEQTSKVVIVSQFTSTMRAFAEALMEMGVEVCGITGKIVGKARDDVVDRFNAPGGPRVLFLQTKSGGVGITLDSADDMIFLDETHRPDDQTQAEDRINNRRPEERVATRRYWYLRSEDTVDEAIGVLNSQLDAEQKSLLDGRRGVSYTGAIFDYLGGKR